MAMEAWSCACTGGYWGCGTAVNKVLWSFFVICALAGTVLVVNGYVTLHGPHECFDTRAECAAAYARAQCVLVETCNGTVLSLDICTSFSKQWCENVPRPAYVNQEMAAGIALLVAGAVLPCVLFLVSRPPQRDAADKLPEHTASSPHHHAALMSQASSLSPAASSVVELKVLPADLMPPPPPLPPLPPSTIRNPAAAGAANGAAGPGGEAVPALAKPPSSRKPSRAQQQGRGKGELLLGPEHASSSGAIAVPTGGGQGSRRSPLSGNGAHAMSTFTIFNPLANPEWRGGDGTSQVGSDGSVTPPPQQQAEQRTPRYHHARGEV